MSAPSSPRAPRRPAPLALLASLALLALAGEVAEAQSKSRSRSSSSSRKSSSSSWFGKPRAPAAPSKPAAPAAPVAPRAPARVAAVAAPVAVGAAAAAGGAAVASTGGSDAGGYRAASSLGYGRSSSVFVYGPGTRVETDVDDVWRPGVVHQVDNRAIGGTRYRVSLDASVPGSASGARWVRGGNLRRAQGQPGGLPAGLYACTRGSGFTRASLGRMRLRPDSGYTGLSATGAGGGGRYRYDAATGALELAGGLQGVAGRVTNARVLQDRRGGPAVVFGYQPAAGGGREAATCRREGA